MFICEWYLYSWKVNKSNTDIFKLESTCSIQVWFNSLYFLLGCQNGFCSVLFPHIDYVLLNVYRRENNPYQPFYFTNSRWPIQMWKMSESSLQK